MKSGNQENQTPIDPNMFMIQALQQIQQQNQAMQYQRQESLAAIADKVSGNGGATNNNGSNMTKKS